MGGGKSWAAIANGGQGGIPDWRSNVIDLKAYAGQSALKLRFRVNGANAANYWYIDDVMVREFQ